MPLPPLSPSTLLPSGWSIDPVTGYCVRISDGAQFGRGTSQAIAWSTAEIDARQPPLTGAAVDVARLGNAIGCAVGDPPFAGNAKADAAAAAAVHAVARQLTRAEGGDWRWGPDYAVAAKFNQRLGCFLDAIGVERARLPATAGEGGDAWLLTGCIGDLAIRSELRVRDGSDARVRLVARPCHDSGSALQCARAWAIDAARAYVTTAAAAVTAFVHRIPFHADDVACTRLIHALDALLADGALARGRDAR